MRSIYLTQNENENENEIDNRFRKPNIVVVLLSTHFSNLIHKILLILSVVVLIFRLYFFFFTSIVWFIYLIWMCTYMVDYVRKMNVRYKNWKKKLLKNVDCQEREKIDQIPNSNLSVLCPISLSLSFLLDNVRVTIVTGWWWWW